MRAHEPASFGRENVKAVILLRVLEKIAKNVRHGRNYFCTFYLTPKFAVCRMVARTLYSKLSYVLSFSILMKNWIYTNLLSVNMVQKGAN